MKIFRIQKTFTLLRAFLFLNLMLIAHAATAQTTSNIRGLRVDPSYFYGLFPGQSATSVATQVVSKAKANGTNTLFVYAYNTVYGAFYPTTYPNTAVEGGYGTQNVLKALTDAAKLNSIKVVAVVPVNNFKIIWTNNPSWRAKNKAGADYIPFTGTYLLSANSPDFQVWLKGFYADLLAKNPDIDGIEAVEPTVDYMWAKDSDYNSLATQQYKALYPSGVLGDQNWLNFRAQSMTNLINILTTSASAAGKHSYLVQTWPVQSNGTLFSSQVIKDNIGLDFDGILNLTGTSKLTYVMAELIWQQWAAEYGPANFTPAWTKPATQTFTSYVGTRSVPLIHIEISPFTGSYASVTPTLTEFAGSLSAVKDLNVGVDVYDYAQIANQNAWTQLTSWTPSVIPPVTVTCPATSISLTSAANSAGATQTCVAALPVSNTSAAPISASVTNGGSYSLVCNSSGSWATTATTSNCPAPAVVTPPAPVTCPAKTVSLTSTANNAGTTQTCVATLPLSNTGTTPISASVTNGGSYSLVCSSTGSWATTASASNCPPPANVVIPTSTKIYGLTLDSVANTGTIVTALKSLVHKPTARVVFDEYVAASYYKTPVAQIHTVSNVMGEILDSAYVKSYTATAYSARTTEYLNALGNNVDIWEIGNEINGEWLGDTPTVVTKMTSAYNLVKAAGKKTALTLYYNQGCWAKASNEMFTWATANIPYNMKQNLDYVLISYYEDDCNGLQPNWPTVFAKLSAMFPNSKIGFGETGTALASKKASYINRYYKMQINLPNYIGGYFWWYGAEDFIPMTNPLWTTFNSAIQ